MNFAEKWALLPNIQLQLHDLSYIKFLLFNHLMNSQSSVLHTKSHTWAVDSLFILVEVLTYCCVSKCLLYLFSFSVFPFFSEFNSHIFIVNSA